MNDLRKQFLEWLGDAYAMEEQAQTMLRKLIERVGDYPRLQNKLHLHLDETKHQAQLIVGCIQKLGSSTSGIKRFSAKDSRLLLADTGIFAEDEVLKGVIASYIFENIKIAAYTRLISAAEKLGENEMVFTLEGILRQEKALAIWLLDFIPEITVQHLQQYEHAQQSH